MLIRTSFLSTQSSAISHFRNSDVTEPEISSLFAVLVGLALASLLDVTTYSGSAFLSAVGQKDYSLCPGEMDTGEWTLARGISEVPTLPCDFQLALTKSSAYRIIFGGLKLVPFL